MYQNFEFFHIGTKSIQEDAKLTFKYKQYTFFFIFDGHGYKINEISLIDFLLKNDYFKKKLIYFVDNNILSINSIKNFFYELDKIFIKKKINSGLCLAGLIYYLSKVFLLNLGDTILYGFNDKKTIISQMPIHNLKNKIEIERIQKYKKDHFIKNNRYKKLSITRTLGDSDCKDLINEPLISIPDVIEKSIKDYTYFLLSTDGIIRGYNINTILNYYNDFDNTKLYKYCKSICLNNIKKGNNVDNIYFYIIHNKNIHQKIIHNILNYLD